MGQTVSEKDEELEPYWMDESCDDGHMTSFRVVDGLGQSVLASKDSATALHYVEILNRAYRAGYKKGFRAAKKA